MSRIKRTLSLLTNYYLLRRTPTFVYSMRRTGTVALFDALKARGVFVIATHELNPDSTHGGRVSGSARWARKHVIRRRKPAKIIALVRNPFDTMASVFAKSNFDAAIVSGQTEAYARQQPSAAELSQQFIENYLENGRYQEQLTWYEQEFRPALKIDVYDHPFDKQRGFARFDEGPYSVLILKTELDDAAKALLVGEFLGLPDFHMAPAKEVAYPTLRTGFTPGIPGDQAPYGSHYERLKSGLTIPESYWNHIVNSRFAQHFFSSDELLASRAKLVAARP